MKINVRVEDCVLKDLFQTHFRERVKKAVFEPGSFVQEVETLKTRALHTVPHCCCENYVEFVVLLFSRDADHQKALR
jgi:hypothetical protein